MSLDRFQTATIDLLNEIATKLENGYTSIAGTFYQVAADDSVVIDVLSNTSPYTLSLVGEAAGIITFITAGDSDIRRTLIFLGPPSHDSCIFTIENDDITPAVIVVRSKNLASNTLDPRGFGSNGDNPISFELRFYPEV